MSMQRGSTGGRRESARYEIRVKGHLDARWADRFDGLSLRHSSDGSTVIHGLMADQAALHGLLQMLRDLGVPLISVAHVEADPPGSSADEPQ